MRRNKLKRWSSALFVLLIAFAMVAQGLTGVAFAQGLLDDEVLTATDITEDPEAFANQEVALEDEVSATLGRGAFTLGTDDQEVLVMTTSPLGFESSLAQPGARVRVVGEADVFERETFEEQFGPVSPRLARRFEDRPYIVVSPRDVEAVGITDMPGVDVEVQPEVEVTVVPDVDVEAEPELVTEVGEADVDAEARAEVSVDVAEADVTVRATEAVEAVVPERTLADVALRIVETVTSVADVVENPERFVDETVTVHGEVSDAINLRAFRLAVDTNEIAVLTPRELRRTLEGGEPLRVTGTVRQFDRAEIEREIGVDLSDEVAQELEGEAVLLASRVAQTQRFTQRSVPEVTGAARANIVNARGDVVGRAAVTRTDEGSVRIRVQVDDLDATDGEHGIHIHEAGICEPPSFTSAGGHFNPTNASHGLLDPEGPHAGDLPNISIIDGRADYEVTTNLVMLEDGRYSLLDANGSAVVIHAQPDDYRTDPSGDSGDRIACGVIISSAIQ